VSGKVSACNDVSDGGVLVSVAEMALKGGVGATIQVPDGGQGGQGDNPPAHAWLFGEDQGRYIVTTDDAESLLEAAEKAGVPAIQIGITGGEGLSLLGGAGETALDALRDANEGWLPEFMGGA